MILECPACSARYRFDETRMASDSALLRCRRCGSRMPVHRPGVDSAPAAPSGAPKPAPAHSLTALLADEAREFRDFVSAALSEEGYEVSVTDDGEEALLVSGSHRFDLVLLNVYLRRMLGTHVCERIKRESGPNPVRVILLGSTLLGASSSPDPRRLYGADAFLSTSATREELIDLIRRVRAGEISPPPDSSGPSGEESDPAAEAVEQSPEEREIRRLARIMISDIQMYHPEKFNRALREGTFFEMFAEELGKGKEIIDQRFGNLANRIAILAGGIRDTLEALRGRSPRLRASGE